MIKYYCDKCGKEIQSGNFLKVTVHREIVNLGSRDEEEWQLCPLCEIELTSNFLNPMLKEG